MREIVLGLYLSGFVADGASTHIALSSGQAREVLMTQNPVINDVIIAGQAGGLFLVTRKIERSWVKWTIRGSIAALHGYAAIHNRQVVEKLR